jgi:predicted TIM-barrel fold metal-dependent hydrolase
MLAAGAAGFGELRPGNQGWDPLGSAGQDLCALAQARGAVLLWHVSEPAGHAYPGKRGGIDAGALVTIAASHPAVRMVGAHLGAGAAFHLLMPELNSGIDYLYFDTAAGSLLYDHRALGTVVDLAGPGRVLFGSDFPLLSPRRQLASVAGTLPERATRDAVCGGNADALFFSSRLAARRR